ncbi:hypothetical protein LTR84_008815 [Exophiala bonariae]|uniref:DRBM domain-containing protein n=1 Tax=Exophiala bonariae TaxID=1690606 RepID=A0AAV9MWS4_9EURO|nr:hypothetical protein LTR84_008815 [Exophiala bonariae]
MVLAVSELPAENNVGKTSLFDSKETSLKDEWLGEKYLNYVLAHLLLRHTSGSMEILSLNGSLLDAQVFLRYDKCYKQLRDNGVRLYQSPELGHLEGSINFREVVLGWTGAIVRRGTPQEREILDRAISDNSDLHGVTFDNEKQMLPTAQTGTTEQEVSPDEEWTPTASETDIWRYTKTLQENFAGQDVVPIYKEVMLRGYPPSFGAEVTFRGKRFSAQAGNKKLAKHRTSQKLCEHFGIEVPGL